MIFKCDDDQVLKSGSLWDRLTPLGRKLVIAALIAWFGPPLIIPIFL